jgi:hypothetical protein
MREKAVLKRKTTRRKVSKNNIIQLGMGLDQQVVHLLKPSGGIIYGEEKSGGRRRMMS